MENPITRAEHEEFRRRLEEENKRQDARICILEDSAQQDRKSTRLNSSHGAKSRMPSSA